MLLACRTRLPADGRASARPDMQKHVPPMTPVRRDMEGGERTCNLRQLNLALRDAVNLVFASLTGNSCGQNCMNETDMGCARDFPWWNF
jgi:hypothetical protein